MVVPVGPGHRELARRAVESVERAWEASKGETSWTGFEILVVGDHKGEKGAAQARNLGLEKAQGGWTIFLDADDVLHEKAFFTLDQARSMDMKAFVIWGQWAWRGPRGEPVVWGRRLYPEKFSWERLVDTDTTRVFVVGMTGLFFTPACRSLWFDERLSYGEGTEFCYAFAAAFPCSITPSPVVLVDRAARSASGPNRQGMRSSRRQREIREAWNKRGRLPLGGEFLEKRRSGGEAWVPF